MSPRRAVPQGQRSCSERAASAEAPRRRHPHGGDRRPPAGGRPRLVLSGHEHNYERFAPQTATGTRDDARGLVEFVVGTGGRSHYPFGAALPNSLVRNSDTYGVLRLALSAGSWSFSFLHEAGMTFTDSGTGTCH